MKKFLEKSGRVFNNFLLAGDKRELQIGEKSRLIFLNAVTLAGGLMISIFSIIGFISGNYTLAMACLAAAAIVFLNLAFIRASRKYTTGGVIDCVVIFIFYMYLAYTGGEAGSGILWSMTYPLITLFLLGPVWGSLTALLYGVGITLILYLPSLNTAGLSVFYSARVIGTYIFLYIFSLIYELVRRATHKTLEELNTNLSIVTQDLVAEKKQTDDILSGVLEGIFIMNKDLELGEAHSLHLTKLLETESIAGHNFLSLLSSHLNDRDKEAAHDFFALYTSGNVNEDLLSEINPLSEIDMSFQRGDGSAAIKRLGFQFIRIAEMDSSWPFLGVVTDKTDEYKLKVKLETEEREHKRAMESLFQIIHVDPVMMREFISDTDAELESVNDMMKGQESSGKEVLEQLFQSAHAIKGNAALLGLNEFAAKVHEYEDSVKAKLQGEHQWRDLLELTLGLAEIRKQLDSLKQLIDKIMRFQNDTRSAGLQDSNLLRYSIEKMIKRESERCSTAACVEFEGFTRESIPQEYRKLVKDILIQFVRNSFAHGFEEATARKQSKKTEEGHIQLALDWNGEAITLRYRDDGRGLDPERIRAKAMSIPELAAKAEAMKPGDLAKLIFHPGFSTTENADMGSGRGVGMSLVKQRVAQAGGKLSVRSAPGQYLEFVIQLPTPDSAKEVS